MAKRNKVDTAALDVTALRGIFQGRRKAALRLAAAWARYREAEPEATFVEFVRLIDPTVPLDVTEYRRHPTYNAAMHMVRSVAGGSKAAA